MENINVMGMPLSHLIVWILFFASILFIGFFFSKRMQQNKKAKLEAIRAYEEKKEKFTYLKPGVFDDCTREDITAAALFHCMRKEDEDFEHFIDNFNQSEKTLYAIYQLTQTLNGPNASLHSFFLSPATTPYVKDIVDMFNEVGSYEIADLMKAARRFAEIIENDLDDEEDDPEMGNYSRYNFSDFTNEFVTLVSTTNLSEKLIDYVLAHKEDFYDYDIPEVKENEEGVVEDEGTSNEI